MARISALASTDQMTRLAMVLCLGAGTVGAGICGHFLEVGHREAEIGEDFLHRDAAVVVKRGQAGLDGGAILFRQFLVVVIDHGLDEITDHAEFVGRQKIEQRVYLLAFLMEIDCHGLRMHRARGLIS